MVGTPDKRYDSFIATIAEKKEDRLNLKNVKILSWNYDVQIELSLKRYSTKKIMELKEDFQIFPNQNSYNLDSGDLINENMFGVIKLNGNAIWESTIYSGEKYKTTLFDKTFEKYPEFLADLISEYDSLFPNNELKLDDSLKYFNFAWETDNNFPDKYPGYLKNHTEAEKIASGTQILVVIGYSFPVFNREIDNKLFNSMTKLKKIYIQDKTPERIQSTMKNAFRIFQPPFHQQNPEKVFQLEYNINQFVIPYEL